MDDHTPVDGKKLDYNVIVCAYGACESLALFIHVSCEFVTVTFFPQVQGVEAGVICLLYFTTSFYFLFWGKVSVYHVGLELFR